MSEYIKRMEHNKMFLLSKEEYDQYKNKTSNIHTCWWLRSPGIYTYYVEFVNRFGCVSIYGNNIFYYDNAIRPALRIPNLRSIKRSKEGYVLYANRIWEVIDEALDLVIAHQLIKYDKFDDKSNNYEASYIKSELEKLSEEWFQENCI